MGGWKEILEIFFQEKFFSDFNKMFAQPRSLQKQ
jgi:hypothetical protein